MIGLAAGLGRAFKEQEQDKGSKSTDRQVDVETALVACQSPMLRESPLDEHTTNARKPCRKVLLLGPVQC